MLLAALACSNGAGTSSSLPLKDVSRLAAQLDTIDAGFTSPQLKSLSALALPMLTAGLELQHMDSTILGKTVEWDPIGERVILTTRPGTPRNVLQVTLYELDETGLPRYPKVEIGYAYLEPLNKFTGGQSDSTSLRFTVFKLPNPNLPQSAPPPSTLTARKSWTSLTRTCSGVSSTFPRTSPTTSSGRRSFYSSVDVEEELEPK